MKTKKKMLKKSMKGRLSGLLCLLAMVGASHASATYSLPADRSVQWQGHVGVSGDIPNRTNICKTLDPTGGDDTTTINSAISNCTSGVVMLNAGTFNVSSMIKVKSNVTLRGAGMGKTIIKGTAGATGSYLAGITGGYYRGTSVNIATGGATKGSSTLTTATAHGLSVGDLVLIDQINTGTSADPAITNIGYGGSNTCSWCGRKDQAGNVRSSGEIAKVVAIPNSTTATLEIPLFWTYTNSAQATPLKGIVANAGFESLTIDNSLSGKSGQSALFQLLGTSNSWLYQVELIGSYSFMIYADTNYRLTIRSSKFHEGVPATPYSGAAYDGTQNRANGIDFEYANSACLVENNALYNLSQPIFLKGATTGNVIAYNYIPKIYRSDNPNWNVDPINFHGGHPMMNLVEGNNVQGRLISDNVWGSASHNTFFRNKNYTPSNDTGGFWNYEISKYSQYFNIIGNVIGNAGFEKTYELNNVTLTGQPSNYRFGYENDGDGSATNNDPKVYNTLLRHGNWTSVANGGSNISWDSNISDHTLPASMYTDKPAWWGNAPWPAIGPDLNPMVSDIPAVAIYKGLTTDPTCTSLNFVSGSATPSSVAPNGTYTISCNYGSQKDAVKASNDLGDCVWNNWSGTVANFTCNAGSSGMRKNSCWLSNSTAENICAQMNSINDVAVTTTYGNVDFSNIVADWKKVTVGSPGDVNNDGNVDIKDISVMMMNWK